MVILNPGYASEIGRLSSFFVFLELARPLCLLMLTVFSSRRRACLIRYWRREHRKLLCRKHQPLRREGNRYLQRSLWQYYPRKCSPSHARLLSEAFLIGVRVRSGSNFHCPSRPANPLDFLENADKYLFKHKQTSSPTDQNIHQGCWRLLWWKFSLNLPARCQYLEGHF